mgnify:CR=1 FL=1
MQSRNAPLIAKAIADEFDTTISGLKKLGSQGLLSTERVFKAIIEGGKETRPSSPSVSW